MFKKKKLKKAQPKKMNEETQIKNNLFLLTFKPNTITMKPKKSRAINNIP